MQEKTFLSRMVSKSSDAQRLDELTKEIEDAMNDLQTDLLAEQAVAMNEIKDRRDEREAVVTSAKQEEANLSVMKQRVQEKDVAREAAAREAAKQAERKNAKPMRYG